MNNTLSILVGDNIGLLQQLQVLLQDIPDPTYSAVNAQVQDSGGVQDSCIGVHVRHVLDHYSCLLDGLDAGEIDYDDRERDSGTETSSVLAQARLRSTIDRLEAIDLAIDCSTALQIRMATSNKVAPAESKVSNAAPDCIQPSSLARELAFLHSHTVHHNASIAVLLRLNDAHALAPDSLGLAPATAIHKEQVKCAR